MIRRLFTFTSLVIIFLVGCTSQTPTEIVVPASTETQAPTATEPPEETPEAVESSTATAPPSETETPATPEIVRPTNDPNCTNLAAFVSDVTIPDNTPIVAGTPFTKTWRVSNAGTCIWGPDYTLSHYSDERMSAPASVLLPLTFPGQTADISVDLIAPNNPGTRRGNFVIKNPAGLIMRVNEDSRLWLIINVTLDAPTPTAASGTATGNETSLVTSTCAFSSEPANITETLAAINDLRAESGLPAYTIDDQLARAAQSHANDMACNSLFGHTGSNGSTFQSRATDSGYQYSSISENVYGSYPPLTGQGVTNWWINDKTDLRNNRNLISNTFTEVGIGYSFFDNFGYYAVVFGTPQ
ncbi:MAG TPA: CAP domain-containing protein [Anaerolineales bacterium]|nr:CAP domain-containing protein [Anaerolineales bacterium]